MQFQIFFNNCKGAMLVPSIQYDKNELYLLLIQPNNLNTIFRFKSNQHPHCVHPLLLLPQTIIPSFICADQTFETLYDQLLLISQTSVFNTANPAPESSNFSQFRLWESSRHFHNDGYSYNHNLVLYQLYNLTNFPKSSMKPIQLISFDQNKQIVVNQEAVNWLNKANQDKHIAIVTVVGKYRTGKSYILNRVLLDQNNGFEVGPTINACTKGLWVWPELIQHPTDPTMQYMVMDTEGLGSLEQGEQIDTKIFLMAMLLSSYFIYNSVGSIDEKAIQSLSLVINLSKLLQKGNQKEMNNIVNCFPSFMWLVRDFALRLEDNFGKAISPNQYLENALKLQQGGSDMVVRKNNIRKELANYFKDRDCFLLIRPVDDESKLQNMAKLKDTELRPQFLDLIGQLKTRVQCNIKKKMFKGKPCSPAMFVELCQYFCTSINQGGLPQLENNWELVCRAESHRIQKRCMEDYKRFLKNYESKPPMEVDLKRFESEANEIAVKLLKIFEKNAMGDKAEKKKAMKQMMISEYQKLKKKIATSKNQALDNLMNNINDQMYSMINQNAINSIFQICQKYDSIIEKQAKGASDQTLCYLYKKCYEGIKANCFSLFGNVLQTHKYDNQSLQQKLNFCQQSLNRIQGQNSKKMQEMEARERQLRQHLVQQEVKAKQAQQELMRAREELSRLTQAKLKNKENVCFAN